MRMRKGNEASATVSFFVAYRCFPEMLSVSTKTGCKKFFFGNASRRHLYKSTKKNISTLQPRQIIISLLALLRFYASFFGLFVSRSR